MDLLEEYKQEISAQNAAYKELEETLSIAIGNICCLTQTRLDWAENLIAVEAIAEDTRVTVLCDALIKVPIGHRVSAVSFLSDFMERLTKLNEVGVPFELLPPETLEKLTKDSSKELCHHIDQDESKYYHTDSSGKKHVFPCNEDEIALCWTCTIICPYRNSAYQGLPSKSQDELEPAFEDDCCCEECREESERVDINNGEAIGRVENLEDRS